MKGNFEHLNERFHYYKGESLFEIVERHFPFEQHIACFNESLAKSIRGKYIDSEIARLKNEYANIEQNNLIHYGYTNKISGQDLSCFQLLFNFDFWKTKQLDHLIYLYSFMKKLNEIPFEHFIEQSFIELLAQGVNDALFEEYLQRIKSDGTKNIHQQPARASRIENESRTQNTPITYEAFDDVFKTEYRNYADEFVKLLRTIEKPCIDDEGKHIAAGLNLGIFKVWYDSLKSALILQHINDADATRLLKKKFSIISMDVSNLRQEKKRASQYKNWFDTQISAIKGQIKSKQL